MDNIKKAVGLGATVIEYPAGNKSKAQAQTPPPEPETPKQHTLDLLQHVPDCSFKRYVQDVAKMCWLPVSSVFIAGLGVASVAISRAYAVQYPDGTKLPLGEYVIPCNPSSTAKSRCLKAFQHPIMDATKKAIAGWKKQEAATDSSDPVPPYPQGFFVTNSSSAALDQSLGKTNGYFALVSSEQGLINTITGAAFTSGSGKVPKNDNDLMLLGFNGDYHHSQRTSRDGYDGDVVGAVTCFAQPKTIETILQQSDGSGMAERFLMLSETTLLGTRDHHQKFYPTEYDQNTYNRIIGEIATTALQDRTNFDELPAYRLSKAAWWAIDDFRNEIEPFLADGGKYSTEMLRSMAGKPDMHVMKIATILAILDESPTHEVPDKWVTAAIGIMRDYLDYILSLLIDIGEIGTNAYEESIINAISKKGTATRKQLQANLHKSKPWAEITPKTTIGQTMRSTIDDLINKGIVSESETWGAQGNSLGKVLRVVA